MKQSNTTQRSLYERVKRGMGLGGEGGKRFGSVVKRMNGGERGHSAYQKYWKWEKGGIIS